MEYTRALSIAQSALFPLINAGPCPAAEAEKTVATVLTDRASFINGRLNGECRSKANVTTDSTNYRLKRTNQNHG